MNRLPIHPAPSALGSFNRSYLGRWPRLSHFAPLALVQRSQTAHNKRLTAGGLKIDGMVSE